MKRRRCARAALCASLFVSPALATPLGASIHVERSERAADCPDAAELTQKVEHILQRSLTRPDASASDELEVQVSFELSRAQYSAKVSSLGPKPGERNLLDHGPNCSALSDAVSVAIALLLDKELARPDAAATPAPPASQPPASPPSRAEPRTAPPQEKPEHEVLSLRAAVEGGAGFGLVGSTTPLLGEALSARLAERVLVDLGFDAALPGSTEHGSGSVRTTLLFGSARACYAFGVRVSLGPCIAFGAGRLRGVGIGYQDPSSEDLTWTAFGAGGLLEAPLWGRVFGGLSGLAWMPTRRSVFAVQRGGTVWESSAIAGSLALRLGFRIW